jgi:drug/metabolite transporter (DMT)-like permease
MTRSIPALIIGWMDGIVAAVGASGAYHAAFAIFKLAADRIEPLRADNVPRMARAILTNWVFLLGLALVLGGLSLHITAMSQVSLAIAVPICMSGVIPLLLVAVAFFGERLTGREWLSLLMIGGALLLLTASAGNPPPIRAVDVPGWTLAVVVAPALIVPLAVQLLADHRPEGRHARPITGIAYGVTSGISIGTAELCIKGWSDAGITAQSLLTPYPYATVTTAAIGIGVMMAAFQRCRMSIVVVVMTVGAKAQLLVTGTILYGEPWPHEVHHFLLRLGALALAVLGVLHFPRHRPLPASRPVAERTPAGPRSPRRGGSPQPVAAAGFGQALYGHHRGGKRRQQYGYEQGPGHTLPGHAWSDRPAK